MISLGNPSFYVIVLFYLFLDFSIFEIRFWRIRQYVKIERRPNGKWYAFISWLEFFSIHFTLISFSIIFFLVVQHFLISYNKGMDGTHTQKKKKIELPFLNFIILQSLTHGYKLWHKMFLLKKRKKKHW